ncbi:6-carboxytetrahydropterin synthase QueD [Polynucleobacter sp. TUM22923]|jgi:6-pyruvoyltetrahydropterin/6-carboxytetrahydropterin synthase|uniref:6-carboxytetrahydropterin synthase QueD n=1 Tax=Polynucleobacter sp. TUM22923 TaxID=3022126 RepID=UPI0025730E63|nr:6-carboxytetrahydropterin synthase QueD [Polynucleobacter sp. TUM22923]BDX21767.1 6-carboxytetrahydropterin synthase QueD [Polynucleobacter sp. TUM22923]
MITVPEAISITRRLEFDAGHRIPNHDGQCRHLHGHRYAIEITLTGAVADHPGKADDGMVLDFGDIKRLATQYIVEPWDHAFLVAKEDAGLVDYLNSIPNHKTVIMECVPTVENLASTAFKILRPVFEQAFSGRLILSAVRLYETPNCWADVTHS